MGATWDGQGTNFCLFSQNATGVELCLFDDTGTHEIARVPLPEYTDSVWHGYMEGLRPGCVYGYRVHGPYKPSEGHRFNPNKLLLDPYATAHTGTLIPGPEIYGYVFETGDDTTFDTRDSAPFVPKCVVTEPPFTYSDMPFQPRAARVPWDSTILYELHVKGYTKLHPEVPETLRGTYAGLGEPLVVDYIRSLGVTSVELLPIHTFVDEPHLKPLGLTNYWGYNTISFFTADPRYAAYQKDAFQEFKTAVSRFHDAGLEVILDVVYNHTAEGNQSGPTLSFKGIDNASYYRLLPDNQRYYINDTGTGNTVNTNHPRVLQMVCDSLRYWVDQAHVDGFRFDLASILGREPGGFSENSAFFKVLTQDPVLNRVKLIAEPWDIGPGGYQLGNYPAGWMEWNDTFRDRTRGFWTGRTSAADFAEALRGTPSIFDRKGRHAWASVNFVTAHDGFTLCDLVSYSEKHNLANGEQNRDGSNDNRSWNCGVEGPTDDPAIRALRQQQMRNMLSSLLLAQGTPMLVAGDEFGRTQGGNNNAYCQDNAISWVDWTLRSTNADLVRYVQHLADIRHVYAALRGTYPDSTKLFGVDGKELDPAVSGATASPCFALLSCDPQSKDLTRFLVLVNGSHMQAEFTMPEQQSRTWTLLADSYAIDEEKLTCAGNDCYTVQASSMALFVRPSTDHASESILDSTLPLEYQA